MKSDDAIILEKFPNRILAEMAAALLEEEGITAWISADDAGGLYPSLQFVQGVRLLVYPEDEDRAREILKAMEEGVEIKE